MPEIKTQATNLVILSWFVVLLVDQDTTVSYVSFVQCLQTVLNPLHIHREGHIDRLDVVVGSEAEHVAVELPCGHDTTLDAQALRKKAHVRHLQIARIDRQGRDGSSRVENAQVEVPVRLGAGRDDQVVEATADLELLGALDRVELGRTELQRLILLAVCAREHNHLATHLGGELDGQVAEAANADDADTVRGGDIRHVQGIVDGCATTHERRGVLVAQAVWDLEEEGLAPDGVRAKAGLVQVGDAVHLARGTEGLPAREALIAAFTGVVFIAPVDAVALFEVFDVGAGDFDGADALVAEGHVGGVVVEVGATDAGVGDFHEDLVALDLTVSGGLLDRSILGSFEDGEIVARGGGIDGFRREAVFSLRIKECIFSVMPLS